MLEQGLSISHITRVFKYSCPFLSMLLLCSCSSSPHERPISASAARESVAASKESDKNKVDMTTGAAATYPADFPFAQYPGSKVALNIVTPAQFSTSVNLETTDSPNKAVAYYKDWFSKNGWKILQQSNTSGLAAISAQLGERQASIMSMPDTGSSGQNSIAITLSSSKK
jgi:hypothetical protein